MELSLIEKGAYEATTGEVVEIGDEFFNDAKNVTYNQLMKEGKITNWKTYYLRKDKKIVPVEQNIVYLREDDGDCVGAVGIVRDITMARKSEKQVIEARDFLENIFKTSADGIMVSDSKGYITMADLRQLRKNSSVILST